MGVVDCVPVRALVPVAVPVLLFVAMIAAIPAQELVLMDVKIPAVPRVQPIARVIVQQIVFNLVEGVVLQHVLEPVLESVLTPVLKHAVIVAP